MDIDWSSTKNEELKTRHGFGFERVVVALSEGALLEERAHPNERYAHQRQLVIEMQGYVWIVPFVTDGSRIFLKTMYPSRKASREYLRG